MADPPALPDDLADWPANPAEVLGVEPGADPRELRRAYTRLIRVYKPERDPDKFQRVRAAYESLLELAEHGISFATAPTDSDSEPTAAEPPEKIELPKPVDAESDAAWAAACEGRVESAYKTLRACRDAGRDPETLYLRLYWLARLHPQLERGKPAARWLIRGIGRHGLTDRLTQMYLAEAMLSDAEAVSERCAAAVVANGGAPYRFVLLHARWEAASRAGDWKLIQNDLNAQRKRLLDESADTWPRLMLMAYDYVAWIDDPAAVRFAEALRVNVQKSEHLGGELDRDFTRFELLCDMVSTLPRDPNAPSHRLAGLIRDAWIADLDRIRTEYLRLAADWLADPEAAFRELDYLASESPASAAYLVQLGSSIAGSAGWTHEAEPNRRERFREHLALRLADATESKSWTSSVEPLLPLRVAAARCCHDELIGFDEFADALADESGPVPAELAERLSNDLPLRCLVEAGRALLGA